MRLEGFLSLIGCIVLLGALLYGIDALNRHMRAGVVSVESAQSP